MDTNTKQHNTKSNWRSKSNHHSSCNITHKQLRLSASNSQKNKKKTTTPIYFIFYNILYHDTVSVPRPGVIHKGCLHKVERTAR